MVRGIIVGLVVTTAAHAIDDCNRNDIDDACDLDCNLPGCEIYPGCTVIADCNLNGVPDDCDIGNGPVIFDGMDPEDHGEALLGAGDNFGGWKFIEKGFNYLGANVNTDK